MKYPNVSVKKYQFQLDLHEITQQEVRADGGFGYGILSAQLSQHIRHRRLKQPAI